MVLGSIDGIDSDDVCPESLDQGNVSLAPCLVGQWIRVSCICACGGIAVDILLICDAFDEELGSICLVEEMLTLSKSTEGIPYLSHRKYLDYDGIDIGSYTT